MEQYTTKTGQNIFDICVTLYGTIEGLIDLLASNRSLTVENYGPKELVGQPLTMSTTLSRGVILNYHQIDLNKTVSDGLEDINYPVAHGEHIPSLELFGKSSIRFIIQQSGITSEIKVLLSYGKMYIDWGDFSRIEKVENTFEKLMTSEGEEFADSNSVRYMTKTTTTLQHAYNTNGEHEIKIFGEFECDLLDFSNINGVVYPTLKTIAKKYVPNTTSQTLQTLIVRDQYVEVDKTELVFIEANTPQTIKVKSNTSWEIQ